MIGTILIPDWTGALLDLDRAWAAIPDHWALLGLCIFCASTSQDLRRYFLVHYWITFLYAYGGGALTAIMIMRPDRAPISILADPKTGFMWTVVWWTMNYFPYRLPWKIHNIRLFQTVTKMGVALCRAKLIVSRVNLGCELYPDSIAGPIILGTVAAFGGTLISDSIRQAQGVLKASHEMSVPTYSWRSAVLSSAAYFLAAQFPYTKFLLPDEAAAIIKTLLVGHSLISSLTGLALDWTQPLMNTALTLLNIPIPGAAQAAAVKQQPKASERAQAAAPAPARPVGQHSAEGAVGNNVANQDKPSAEPRAPKAVRQEPAAKKQASVEEQLKASGGQESDDAENTSASEAPATRGSKNSKGAKKAAAVSHGWTEVVHRGKKA